MTRRINITIDESQYDALQSSSRETGASVAELVRRAISSSYVDRGTIAKRIAAVRQSAGIWSDRDDEIYSVIRSGRVDFRDQENLDSGPG